MWSSRQSYYNNKSTTLVMILDWILRIPWVWQGHKICVWPTTKLWAGRRRTLPVCRPFPVGCHGWFLSGITHLRTRTEIDTIWSGLELNFCTSGDRVLNHVRQCKGIEMKDGSAPDCNTETGSLLINLKRYVLPLVQCATQRTHSKISPQVDDNESTLVG